MNLLQANEYPGPIYTAFKAMGFTKPKDFGIIDLKEFQELNPLLTPANW